MWSKCYQVTAAELRELHSAMDRHDGLFYLAAAAGFVADHQAQGDRLDFGGLFNAYRDQFLFLVGGSYEDPFEHLQIDLAQERLGKLGLQIERLPGGHLTTNEQPEALAALIAKFERGLARVPERAGGAPTRQNKECATTNKNSLTSPECPGQPFLVENSCDRNQIKLCSRGSMMPTERRTRLLERDL